MTGQEFRAIRKSNLITQEEIGMKIFRSISTIIRIEKSDYVPAKFIKALSEMIGVDLYNDSKLEMIKEGIPKRYYEKHTKPLQLFNY